MSTTHSSQESSSIDAALKPQTLREYALIADGERGALIGPQGDFAWMCAPHWDSDAVFSSLIGGSGCSSHPERRFRLGWLLRASLAHLAIPLGHVVGHHRMP